MSVTQIWCADDTTALGTITGLRDWWDNLTNLGPGFGYHTNSAKTWLVTKDSYLSYAVAAFAGTNVNVTSSRRPHLGVPVGSPEYCESFVVSKVSQWSSELKLLSEIATTQPHAAFAAFIHGFSSRWLFIALTVPNLGDHYQPLENIIRSAFIPQLLEDLHPMTPTEICLHCLQG